MIRQQGLKQAGWKLLDENKIKLLGRNDKFVKSREIGGQIKTVTVKRDNLGRLWVCFSVVMSVPILESTTGQIGGFDFGLRHFLTNDDGETIESPQFFRQSQRKIAALNRTLSRKRDDSNNRKRAKYRLAKAHDRIKNQRRDWFFKLAHALCDRYSVLCFEDLHIKAMQQLWGRKVSDLAFSEFLKILEHIALLRGCLVKFVDRWEPTTQVCSACGHRQKLPLRERTFRCGCGLILDRDHNAALNIKRVGASTHSREAVRLVDVSTETSSLAQS